MEELHLGAMSAQDSETTQVLGVRKFSQEEFLQYEEHNKTISFHIQNKKLYELIVKNGEELEGFINKIYITPANEIGMTPETIIFETNRLLMNYLSMLRTYDDHISSSLSAKFSDEVKEGFKKFLSQLYDDFFEYRFLSRLRNFAQHFKIPVTGYINSVDGNSIYMGKESLLTYRKWSGVKDEIEQMDEQIDVQGFAAEMNNIMKLAYIYVLDLYANDVMDAYKWLESLYKELDNKHPVLIKIRPGDQENGTLNVVPMNTNMFLAATRDLNDHPNFNINS
ncbi:hypothetical protein [Peribacillus asahii]|uniref:hypothetical protein n=1 Tax=Peribacillus asahii TaxID=228899 RepID=UPI0020796180|nr:hypothetical protein [Peribacillus asahii]USK85714.1 hypothetical protein LIT35_03340 [Peribacillus asahii]